MEGLHRHGSLQADVPVAEEEPHSPQGAVTALSAGTASAFLLHWGRSHPSWRRFSPEPVFGRAWKGWGWQGYCSCEGPEAALASMDLWHVPHHGSRF